MPAPSFLRTRTARRGAVLAAVAMLTLAGCSDDTTEPDDDEGNGAPQRIEVTLTGDEVSPMGERVEVEAGEPVIFEITADRAGELHVHSTPEQTLAFEDGTVERELTLDQPGVVEVESHDPDLTLVQLEVR